MEIFEEEKKRLNYTLDVIDDEIKRKEKNIEDIKNDSLKLSFEDRQRGTHFQLNTRLKEVGNNIYQLNKAKKVHILPELDTSPIEQQPFLTLLNDYTDELDEKEILYLKKIL